jgi:hypothetical protein
MVRVRSFSCGVLLCFQTRSPMRGSMNKSWAISKGRVP